MITTPAAGLLGAPGGEPSTTVRGRYLMGTRLLIECRGEVAPQVFEEAFAEVSRLERIFSNWIESSEISRLNREAFEAPLAISSELLQAVELSLVWAERTGGAFDPTVESLVRRYGIRSAGAAAGDPDASDDGRSERGPEKNDALQPPVVGWRHVVVHSDRRAVQLTREGIGIDLGGIGKGIALDRAAEVLASRGIGAGLLDFGGQVLAFGTPPAGGWLIGVADPDDRQRPVAAISLLGGSLATSGNSQRAVLGKKGTVGHILDPRVGTPAPFGGSLSVLAADATTADALSTALFVMGPAAGSQWAEERGIAALFIWREAGNGLRFLATSAMSKHLTRVPEAKKAITGG